MATRSPCGAPGRTICVAEACRVATTWLRRFPPNWPTSYCNFSARRSRVVTTPSGADDPRSVEGDLLLQRAPPRLHHVECKCCTRACGILHGEGAGRPRVTDSDAGLRPALED